MYLCNLTILRIVAPNQHEEISISCCCPGVDGALQWRHGGDPELEYVHRLYQNCNFARLQQTLLSRNFRDTGHHDTYDTFHNCIDTIFQEIQCRVLDKTIEAAIKNPIKCMKEGDLVHKQQDWAEFLESAPATSSFYFGSLLHLGQEYSLRRAHLV